MTERTTSPHLLDTERRLRLFVDSVHDYALLMLDPQGKVVSWHAGARNLKGYSAEEIIGKHFSCFYPIEDVVAGKPDLQLRVATRTGRFEDVGILLRKDGSRFWANVIITAIHDENGELIGFGKIAHDITERIEAEQKLAESEAKLKTLVDTVLDTVVDGLVIFNAAGEIQFANPACEQQFGYRSSDLVGRHLSVLLPEMPAGSGDALLEHFRRSDAIAGADRELVGRRRDGSTFPMELSVGEGKNDDESIFIAVVHDLTRRKKTEQQLIRAQKMETVGQLSGGIAHDFNNLLTVIVGNADTMSDLVNDQPDLKQYCESIVAAGMRGADLTQRLLAFGRRQALKPAPIDCNQLVGGLQKLLRRTLREDIDIRTNFETETLVAFADPVQLESAILNLALNAQDAMPEGGHLAIATGIAMLDEGNAHPEVRPGRYVMIAVTDDGSGMPPEVRERVFEPFFTTKDVGKGTGLGLSMVYGFVKQSNGHIAIYSEPGLGTTIRIYLPEDSATPRPIAPDREEKALPDGHERVLVTEDDPFVRSYAVASLEGLGYEVITAGDSREAVAKLADGANPDVLFTDVIMPGGINGWELAQEARKIRPGLKVLLTSGYALDTLINSGRLSADTPLLRKPYRRADLARALRQTLDAPAERSTERSR